MQIIIIPNTVKLSVIFLFDINSIIIPIICINDFNFPNTLTFTYELIFTDCILIYDIKNSLDIIINVAIVNVLLFILIVNSTNELIINNLSAIGSNNSPIKDSLFNNLANIPSKKSVTDAIKNIIINNILDCSEIIYININIIVNAILVIVSIFGIFFLIIFFIYFLIARRDRDLNPGRKNPQRFSRPTH